MHLSHILLLIVAINAAKFLEEPAVLLQDEEKPYMLHTIFAQQSSLFTDEELSKNIEMYKQPTNEFNFEDENQTPLGTADPSQILLATSYEKDLPASGDCVILYQSCDFKGTSGKVCKTEEALNFQLPVYSIYVPLGQQFTTLDSNTNVQVAFLTSEKCLKEPLIMADSQKDVFIAKASVSLAGEEELKADESMGPQPQLLIDTQETFDAPEVQDQEMSAQPVEATEAQPVEATEAQPVETTEAQPVETSEAQPVETTEAQPVEATEAQPVETTEAQPVETTEAQPVENTEAQPTESTEAQPAESAEAQPEAQPETQPETQAQPASAETAQPTESTEVQSETKPIVEAQPEQQAEPLVGQSQ